jgi:hypothetical protein
MQLRPLKPAVPIYIHPVLTVSKDAALRSEPNPPRNRLKPSTKTVLTYVRS